MMTQNSQSVKGLEDADVSWAKKTAPIGTVSVSGREICGLIEARSHGRRAGQGIVWLETQHDMVEGEPTADLSVLMGMVDTANGIVPASGLAIWLGLSKLWICKIRLHR